MIYCIEDENSIRDLIIYTLKMAGYTAKGYPDSSLFWQDMESERPALILLDIMLPCEDGITILKKLRASPVTSEIPVIMTTAKGTEYDRVIALDLGADDYLCKPFGMMEMVSRIKAVLRRTNPSSKDNGFVCGEIRLDETRHSVISNGQSVSLTFKEYELLRMFIRNPGTVFSRENLLCTVWGTDYLGESRTVDVHIGTLRTKLGAAGQQIKTVRGVGYKMEASDEQ